MGVMNKQVGGNYYKHYKIQPYEFFHANSITHDKAAVIRRILRFDQVGGKGIEDLNKIRHELDMMQQLRMNDGMCLCKVFIGDNETCSECGGTARKDLGE